MRIARLCIALWDVLNAQTHRGMIQSYQFNLPAPRPQLVRRTSHLLIATAQLPIQFRESPVARILGRPGAWQRRHGVPLRAIPKIPQVWQ